MKSNSHSPTLATSGHVLSGSPFPFIESNRDSEIHLNPVPPPPPHDNLKGFNSSRRTQAEDVFYELYQGCHLGGEGITFASLSLKTTQGPNPDSSTHGIVRGLGGCRTAHSQNPANKRVVGWAEGHPSWHLLALAGRGSFCLLLPWRLASSETVLEIGQVGLVNAKASLQPWPRRPCALGEPIRFY